MPYRCNACFVACGDLQMASSDEELKQQEGGIDMMDVALAFGDGPAKELFGVELSAL